MEQNPVADADNSPSEAAEAPVDDQPNRYFGSLADLRRAYQGCQGCALHVARTITRGRVLCGEASQATEQSTAGCVMFIGETPSRRDLEAGHVFSWREGELLRSLVASLQLPNVYYTNTVWCRSVDVVRNRETDEVETWKDGTPKFMDRQPLPAYREACRHRLFNEIYLVDPLVIVTLGQLAADTVAGRSVKLGVDREGIHVNIPGVLARASLTDKAKKWARKVKGKVIAPIEVNQVRYMVIPTFSQSLVLSHEHTKYITDTFVADLRRAAGIYHRHQHVAYGEPLVPVPEIRLNPKPYDERDPRWQDEKQ